ncbi:MAG: fructokinase [Oleiphilaceae bacterium]
MIQVELNWKWQKNRKNLMKIGIDLGGTKIEVIVLSEQGQALWRERTATPQGNYEGTLDAIKYLIAQAKSKCILSINHPVGIASPGALFLDKGQNSLVLKNSNSIALNGRPFLDDLKERLACEVYLENDANCFALAEALSGVGIEQNKKPKSVFGVILGTGVGGGLVIQQCLHSGRHHIAGEWGHNTLPASALMVLPEAERNRLCYCGRKDCIETYLSGPGLSKSYSLRFSEDKNSKDIIDEMRNMDAQACSVWESYVDQLAVSLAQVVNILDPEIIVLGGGMSLISEIYQILPERIQRHVFTEVFSTPILPAKLGDSAGVFGAAWLTA